MSDTNQTNKALVLALWEALDGDDADARESAVAAAMAPGLRWFGHAPVGELHGADAFLAEAWEPLRVAFPELRRDTFIFIAGASNGRADGDVSRDGKHWVTGTGVLRGTFASDYLGIPATGAEVAMRYGEFCRVVDGRIDEIYLLIDVVDLMEQAGVHVLPPCRGRPGLYPPPRLDDGVLVDAQDQAVSDHSLDHLRRFLYDGLNVYDQEELSSMGMADWFHPDVQWYGPGGIGACLSLQEFEDNHQRPWLVAYPDRQVQDLTAIFAEGVYSAAPGWAGVKATHTGPYLDAAATGATIVFNGLDWWKREGEQYVENWVFVDMVHLFDQFGIDLFERMRSQVS
ncbi:MAG: ester cyclase [Actinomycetota bacterium]